MRSRFRILDAAFNRAREAFRVLEDLARFNRDDAAGAARLKEARHRLDGEARAYRREFLAARDSARDVGRDGDRPVRSPRALADVAAANLKRAQEALRTIEEVSKGGFGRMSRVAHGLRYELYAVEKALADPARRLAAARLYVILDPSVARRALPRVAEEAIRGGADLVQFRQKPKVDLGLAREVRAASRDVLFVMNDDAGAALACGADGVHLGREDLPVPEARRLAAWVVGATTHSLVEARRAVREGADYISVGPMFPTPLKPGLAAGGFGYLAAARRLGVPHFCIGGITAENADPRMGRAAVCAGVIGRADPAAAARAIRRRLTSGS